MHRRLSGSFHTRVTFARAIVRTDSGIYWFGNLEPTSIMQILRYEMMVHGHAGGTARRASQNQIQGRPWTVLLDQLYLSRGATEEQQTRSH